MMRKLLVIASCLLMVSSVLAQEGTFSGGSPVAGPASGIWKNTPPIAAVSGTDYAPATSGSSILLGNGAGGHSNYAGVSGIAHQWISALSAAGAATQSQPACGDLSNGAASCSTDTTNASNISSGTLAAARGGAGTITGALKGNGSGTVSQAACADLSNGTTNCSAAVGQLPGTTTNDNASAGNIGEHITANVASGSAISLTTGTAANVTSISLTAGDWDVYGVVAYNGAGTTVTNLAVAAVTTSSASLPASNTGQIHLWQGSVTQYGGALPVGRVRFSLASTTTVFLVAFSNFTTSTNVAYGYIAARRVR